MPEDYSVPTFHPMATENEAIRWDFWVRHYQSNALQARDTKYYAQHCGKPVDGVLYPRAGALGGCTAHNAMIMVYPHNADWDAIAESVGDASWNSDNMRGYFQRLENCQYRPFWRVIKKVLGWNPTRHGFGGWLSIEKALPKSVVGDKALVEILTRSALGIFKELRNPVQQLRELFVAELDPNDWRINEKASEAIHYAPLSTHQHARNGTREFVLDAASKYPLTIELDAVVTKVLFDDNNRRSESPI
jgi:choline dehydrogenase